MPNPKSGTVTFDIGKAVADVKTGKVEYRTDRTGIVHIGIGKRSFEERQLIEIHQAVIEEIVRVKPAASKGATSSRSPWPRRWGRASRSTRRAPRRATSWRSSPRRAHPHTRPKTHGGGTPASTARTTRAPVRGRRDAEGPAPRPARPRGPEHGGDPLRRDEKEAAIAALSERLAASETVFAPTTAG